MHIDFQQACEDINHFEFLAMAQRNKANLTKYYYCKTHYYRAPFNFTHFALGDDNAYITGADIRLKQHNNVPSSGDAVDECNSMVAIRSRR